MSPNSTQPSAPRLTGIQYPDGRVFVAPTDQWIVLILDSLHPDQQAGILEKVAQLAQQAQSVWMPTDPQAETVLQ